MAAIGVEVVGTTPAQYAKIIADDYAKWGKVVLRRYRPERIQAGVSASTVACLPLNRFDCN